jgi:hypothetical protein
VPRRGRIGRRAAGPSHGVERSLHCCGVALDGSEIATATKPRPNGTLVKVLARAWRWQRMLDEGVYATVSEIGDAENISKSYVSRILRLALLAPDIVDAIPCGKNGSGYDAGAAGATVAGE